MSLQLEHKIRVRYAECDQMGFVHHSVYALYLEEARTEILRKFGLIYAQMEKEGILMPLRSMHFDFKKAAKYDDMITVSVSFVEEPLIRCDFNYTLTNQQNELICTARTDLFFVRKDNLRPIKLPEHYLEKILPIFEEKNG